MPSWTSHSRRSARPAAVGRRSGAELASMPRSSDTFRSSWKRYRAPETERPRDPRRGSRCMRWGCRRTRQAHRDGTKSTSPVARSRPRFDRQRLVRGRPSVPTTGDRPARHAMSSARGKRRRSRGALFRAGDGSSIRTPAHGSPRTERAAHSGWLAARLGSTPIAPPRSARRTAQKRSSRNLIPKR